MMTIFYLLTIAHQFVAERDWWQFHNPKNEAMNLMVEVGELAEHFIESDSTGEKGHEIAEELSDVLFGCLLLALQTKIDIAQTIGNMVGKHLSDQQCSYTELQEIVLKNPEQYALGIHAQPTSIMLSLVTRTSELGDIFIWNTGEESIQRAQEKHKTVEKYLVQIIAHLIYLAEKLEINLPHEYLHKMQKNGLKYPVKSASAGDYAHIKDQSRNR